MTPKIVWGKKPRVLYSLQTYKENKFEWGCRITEHTPSISIWRVHFLRKRESVASLYPYPTEIEAIESGLSYVGMLERDYTPYV